MNRNLPETWGEYRPWLECVEVLWLIFFSATLMDSFQLLNSFDFRFQMCFSGWHQVSWNTHCFQQETQFWGENMLQVRVIRGETHGAGILLIIALVVTLRAATCFVGVISSAPEVSSRDGILFVKSHGCCTFSCICHCNRHILRQMSRYFMVDFGKVQGGRREWRYMGHNLDAWLLTRSHPAIPELSQAAS